MLSMQAAAFNFGVSSTHAVHHRNTRAFRVHELIGGGRMCLAGVGVLHSIVMVNDVELSVFCGGGRIEEHGLVVR